MTSDLASQTINRSIEIMAAPSSSSVLQLSTFTKVPSIPREESVRDFPVMVRLKAAEMAVHQRAPVDVVAVIDVSWSMGWDDAHGKQPNDRMVLVKEAMEGVIRNLGGAKNRLAVVAFDHEIKKSTGLVEMTEQGQKTASEAVKSLRPYGRTVFSIGLNEASRILTQRGAVEKERLAFIVFLTDGSDPSLKKEDIPRAYPIHGFGFSADHNPKSLQEMADVTSGSYTPVTKDLGKIAEKLDQLSDKLTSIVAVDTLIQLKALHPGVLLSKIEASAATAAADDEAAAAAATTSTTSGANNSKSLQIAGDKQSGKIVVGDISSGEVREFVVYLDVPEGQGGDDGDMMDLLMVGGVYTQSWDQKQVELAESVVAVARPARCKALDLIEERLEHWCKVKQEVSAKYDTTAPGVKLKPGQCHVTEVLRQASLEAINNSMYRDIYEAVLLAIKLRHGGGSAAPAETERMLPPTPAQTAKAV